MTNHGAPAVPSAALAGALQGRAAVVERDPDAARTEAEVSAWRGAWCASCAWCSDPTGQSACVLPKARAPNCPEWTRRLVPAMPLPVEDAR